VKRLTPVSPKLVVPQHLLLEFQSFKNDSGPRAPSGAVDAELLCIGVVADIARLDDDRVFAVIGMRPVPAGGDLAADPAVIERKGPKSWAIRMSDSLDSRQSKKLAKASFFRSEIRATDSN
jgi:hypothetical protein